MLDLLRRLQLVLDGALALLSGRTLANLSEMFAPLSLTAAGVHGLEYCLGDGCICRRGADDSALELARIAVGEFAAAEPRVLVEDKGNSLAVHYRAAPERFDDLSRLLGSLADRLGPGFHVQEGLYVLELKPSSATKGSALRRIMGGRSFGGRTPVAIGDDLTDVHAFRAAEGLGGMSIAVGDRVRAQWQVRDPASLHRWLGSVIDSVSVDRAS